jgi:cytochrome c oxidase cbb3-type subunit 4
MDAGTWRGVFTVIMFLLFAAICIWAWSGRRKKDFEEAANLPLEPDYPGESAPAPKRRS